ncbi:hypothetical protein [Microtetraspora malaysiensis]|uniref:ABC transporter permease n=1 Tax=Microtetraspora malaysiensis TaxID=161358 RepID=A0ABW6SMF2_9ACTN
MQVSGAARSAAFEQDRDAVQHAVQAELEDVLRLGRLERLGAELSPIATGPGWMYAAIAGAALLLVLAATIPTAVSALRVRPVEALNSV